MMTPTEFAALIKNKHPEYREVEDEVLVERVLEKFPQYQQAIIPSEAPQTPVESQLDVEQGVTPETAQKGLKTALPMLGGGVFPQEANQGLEEEELKEAVTSTRGAFKKAVTAGQFGAAVFPVTAPFSPATEFAGEAIKSLIDGRGFEDALKAGSQAAAVDVGFKVATAGILGSRSVKAGKFVVDKLRKMPRTVGERTADFIVRNTLKGKGLSDEAITVALNNPDDLLKVTTTVDKAAAQGVGKIRRQRRVLGEAVGKAREKAAKQAIKVTDDLSGIVAESFQELSPGDSIGNQALKFITDQVDEIPAKTTHGEFFKRIKHIKDSDVLKTIFKKSAETGKKSLSEGEKGALAALRGLEAAGDDAIMSKPVREALKTTRNKFRDFASIMDEVGLPAFKGGRKELSDKVLKSVKIGNTEDLGALKRLENRLPKTSKFLNKAIATRIREESVAFSVTHPHLSGVLSFLLGKTAKSIKTGGAGITAATAIPRRLLIAEKEKARRRKETN